MSAEGSRLGSSVRGKGGDIPAQFNDYLRKLPPPRHSRDTFNRGSVPGSTFSKKRLIDGSNFLGEIKDGKPHGYGLIVYPANDKQQRDRFGGEFRHGTRVGEGSMTWKQGSQYAGEWASDKPNGYGGETGVDWSVYVGQWQDDDKHGMGIYTFADGSEYEGEWRNGQQHGRGILVKDDTVTQVEYRAGNRVEFSTPLPDAELESLVLAVRETVRRAREVWERTLRVLGEHEHDWAACALENEPPRRRVQPQRALTTKTHHTRGGTEASDAHKEGVQKGWERMEREGLSTAAWGAWRDRAARRISQVTNEAAQAAVSRGTSQRSAGSHVTATRGVPSAGSHAEVMAVSSRGASELPLTATGPP